jgi:nucleotide-binding universal stress UspA family protein
VVGYDGSGLSESALKRAVELAGSSSFALIHVVTLVSENKGRIILPNGHSFTSAGAIEATRLTVGALVESWGMARPSIRVLAHIRVGSGPQALIDFAYRFHGEQILVGATGIGNSSKPIGSFAQGLLERSCDLAVHVESAGFAARSISVGADRWSDAVQSTTLTRSLAKIRGQLTLS